MSKISWDDGDVKFESKKNQSGLSSRTHGVTDIGVLLRSASKWNHLRVQSQQMVINKKYLFLSGYS